MFLLRRFPRPTALGCALTLAAGLAVAGVPAAPGARAQTAPGTLGLPAVFVTAGAEAEGFDFSGASVDTEGFDFDPGEGVNGPEAFSAGYLTRNGADNPGFNLVVADADSGDAFVTLGSIDSSCCGVRFGVSFGPDDLLAVGNVDGANDTVGGSFEEILVARSGTGGVDVYQSGLDVTPIDRIASLSVEVAPGDDVVAANVVGVTPGRDGLPVVISEEVDEIDEVLLADADADVVELRSAEAATALEPVALPFDPGDRIAAANLDGRGADELLHADASTGIVDVLRYVRDERALATVASISAGFGAGDGVGFADVDGNATSEVLVADDATGEVTVFRFDLLGGDGFFTEGSFDVGFTSGAEFDVVAFRYPDVDGDDLFDHWEESGVDVDGDGLVDIDLPGMGADPRHKDLFVEYDWMPGETPAAPAVQRVTDAFAAAPKRAGGPRNPDDAGGINLWIDTGQLGGGNELDDGAGEPWSDDICDLGFDDDGDDDGVAEFYEAKALNFDPVRANVFRYAISATPCEDDDGPGGRIDSPGGRAEGGGNDLVEFIQAELNPGEVTIASEASTFMHELGHTLGLGHGGFENHNCKPNYVSIMNYDLNFIERTDGSQIIDFSPPRFPGGRGQAPVPGPDGVLDERSLSESTVVDPTDPMNQFVFTDPDGVKRMVPLGEAVDWNQDGDTADEDLSIDIDVPDVNGNPELCGGGVNVGLGEVEGHHDWSAISVPFRQFGEAEGAPVHPAVGDDPTLEEIIQRQEDLHTTDLSVSLGDTPDPVVAGERLEYDLVVTNGGANPARDVEAVVTLPDGVGHESDDAGCEVAEGAVTCALGYLLGGQSRTVQVTGAVAPDLASAGGPVTVATMAEAIDTGLGEDPDTADNEVTESTEVVAEADLAITGFGVTDAPAEILVGAPTDITVETIVTNHGPSGPVDAVLDVTGATVGPGGGGLAVEPDPANPGPVPAVAVDQERAVAGTFTVSCREPGRYELSFTSGVAPADPDDVDPDPANDDARAERAVECLVPVEVDVEPDRVNVGGGGVVPVTVESTTAGADGATVTFDATTVDPLSVRFGPRDRLFDVADPAGAAETHGRGHPAGDDLVLHFRARDAGLAAGEAEACVRGTFRSGDATHAFLGCDDVEVITERGGRFS